MPPTYGAGVPGSGTGAASYVVFEWFDGDDRGAGELPHDAVLVVVPAARAGVDVITATDLFCGAGGSSLGAQVAGVELVMASNHWPKAIEVHNTNFPDAGHDCADISQVHPPDTRGTDILLASPECTNHSNAKGVSRQGPEPRPVGRGRPVSDKSRATMWDVHRFVEHHQYDAVIVENVVDAVAGCTGLVVAGVVRRRLRRHASSTLNSAHTGAVGPVA